MHTTACPRRFWTFFDFSSKGESRGNKECYESKDMVSPSLFPNSDLDDVSKSPSSNTTETFSPWYSNECQFDLKSMPMNCLRVQRPPKEESLVSLLDGHPVPKMLKWKLKGYKTLRNEKAIDFAFVPGGKPHEFDILPRNERRTSKVTDNLDDTAERQESLAIRKKTGDNDKKDTLRLTTKAIENKVETEAEDIDKIVENDNGLETDKSRNVSNQNLAKLGSSVRKEDVKYLPILKSEMKYQTQPAARFSSRPPKKIRKPSAPILKRADCERPDKEIPSIELDEEKDVLEPEDKRAISKPSVPKFSELTENSAEWSSVESQRNQEYPVERETKTEETKSNSLESSAEASPQNEPNAFETTHSMEGSSTESPAEDLDRVADEKRFEPRSSAYFAPVERGRVKTEETKSDAKDYDSLESSAEASPQSEPKAFETTRSRDASSTESPAEDLGRVADEKRFEPRSSVYFAPRASKQNPRSSIAEGMTLESIIGIPERTAPRLNITRPDEGRVRSSPCAATRARLRQSGNRSASSSQMDSFGNGKSQSVPGNSGGGSRKPPASFPPVAIKRSSSNASCLLEKAPVSKGTGSAPSSKNSSLNISTSSANPARKCREENEECSRTRRKKCERERPCKSDKKTCKRYCCPALQAPTSCDFNKFQCPKDTCGQSVQPRKVRDPTCLPNDEYNDQGKKFGTTLRKREDCNRSCKRERSGPCSERCIMPDFDHLVNTGSDTFVSFSISVVKFVF
ncbi:hypothetical protein K0M31_014357 [Melipona bicolor]|uniref:Uncharacterized protein n=1 Tax=Melipona bicolor TaxID=60889 RepID=A0AA40KU87_9HYME|nr:hypothetical protein K0M31_014357 [Melipona bicolor]